MTETTTRSIKTRPALIVRMNLAIPINLADAASLPAATAAVEKIRGSLPTGSTVQKVSEAFGKMPATAG